jgi:RNA polymerase sigma-70 factor, ECF subfamily
MVEMTETHLITRSLQGDQAALEDLVERHAPAAFRLALSILVDPGEAEEAAQEAWIKALSHLDNYRGEASFQTWLYTITLNACRARLRKRSRIERLKRTLQSILQLHQEHRSHLEEELIQRERGDQVLLAVRSLDENQRLAITLRYYHELPISQIAQVMQVSERMVYTNLRGALQNLQTILESDEGVL